MLAHYWLHVVVQNSLGEIFAHCTEQFSQALKILAMDSTEQDGRALEIMAIHSTEQAS